MQKTEGLSEFIKALVLFIPSLAVVFKGWQEYLKANVEKAKEKSVGSEKVKQLESQVEAISQRFTKMEWEYEEAKRRLSRVESIQDGIRQSLELNMQQSINTLLKGNR